MARRSIIRYTIALLALLIPAWGMASPPSRTYTYTANTTIEPTEVITNEDNIYNYLTRGVDSFADGSITTDDVADGTLLNADISASAGITDTKLANITSSGKVNATAIVGTLGLSYGGTNATSAQGALNNLAGGVTANRVLRGDGSNVTLSQVNATVDITGTLPIANGGTNSTTAAGAYTNIAAFGSWSNVTAACSNVVAANDGIICAMGSGTNFDLIGYTDGNNPPTTEKAHTQWDGAGTETMGITFPVRKGDRWTVSGGNNVWWLPIGN